MDVTHPHQRRDVGFVRLSGERVAEKQDGLDFSFRHPAADDQVAPFRSVSDAFHLDPELVRNHLAGVASRDQTLRPKEIGVSPHEFEHPRFLLVVSDEGYHPRSLAEPQ